jgi:hypothetical protein
MSPREKRTSRNQEILREVNLNIAELDKRLAGTSPMLQLVCECAESGCAVPIEVDAATFAHSRENPTRFFVALGHERLEIESVVERRDGFLIVEKNSER